MRHHVSCVLAMAALLAGVSPAPAAVLSGRVTDAQGAPLAGVQLRLSSADHAARTFHTNDVGDYRVEGLSAGVYLLEASKGGFQSRISVVTLAQEPAALDLQLEVAGVAEKIVVTANGLPQAASEIAKAVTTVDGDDIRARNEATLGEIVRYTPGVQIRTNGGPGQLAQMRIRGLRPDAAAVLVDGVRFRDASTSQGDATSFLSTLNFVAAERVEILRGSGSSLYGTNAVGGVVNVVTREGRGPFHAEGQAEGGSLGWVRGRGMVSGGLLDDRLGFTIGALRHTVAHGVDDNDRSRSTGGQASLRYDLSAKTALSLRFFGSDDEVRLNSSPTANGIPAANIPSATIIEAVPGTTYLPVRDDTDNARASSFHTTALMARHRITAALSAQATLQRVHTSRVFRNGPAGAGSQPRAENYSNYAGEIDTADARVLWRPGETFTLTAGYEIERERYLERQDNNMPAPARVATEARIAQDAQAGFGSIQAALLERRLHVSLSSRVQTFRLSRPTLSATGTPNAYEMATLEPPPTVLTSDLSAAYLFARSGTKLRVHLGNAYRAPSMYERFGGGFSNDPVSGGLIFSPFGDPRLEPDEYRSIDAGIDQPLFGGRVLLSATGFYTKVLALTAFDSSGGLRPDADPFGRSMGYINGSGGFSRGVELGAEARPFAWLRGSASYTFTDAETDRDIMVAGFYQVPNVFQHTASLIVSARPAARLDATADILYASAHFAPFFAAGRSRAYRFPGFARTAVVAGYRLSRQERRPLRMYIRCDNLLNHTFYEAGWRALGRTVVAGLSFGY